MKSETTKKSRGSNERKGRCHRDEAIRKETVLGSRRSERKMGRT